MEIKAAQAAITNAMTELYKLAEQAGHAGDIHFVHYLVSETRRLERLERRLIQTALNEIQFG